MYTPKADEVYSEDDDEDDLIVTQARKKDWKRNQGAGINLKKAREEIMLEDDGLVVDSDSDVDLGDVFGNNTNAAGDDATNEAYDVHSDGNDSWESLEMKTPPNSEDEDDHTKSAMPVFKEGLKFGEVRLEVEMKFKNKRDFMEAVREFTLQEGRRIVFKRNESS
ncbi:hypothetical protein PIB30_113519, partial [Stylosanthes scabra]|nr:hypothetical protein [Stylosanthes scabra]